MWKNLFIILKIRSLAVLWAEHENKKIFEYCFPLHLFSRSLQPGPALLFFIFRFEYLISGPKSYRDFWETGPRSENGSEKWHFLVWNRVWIWRTERYTPPRIPTSTPQPYLKVPVIVSTELFIASKKIVGFYQRSESPRNHFCLYTQRPSTNWGGALRDETKTAARGTTAIQEHLLRKMNWLVYRCTYVLSQIEMKMRLPSFHVSWLN